MTIAPYGSWASPLTVDQLTSASVGLSEVRLDSDQCYWLESRADQQGRTSLWRTALAGGESVEVTPGSANLRTRVHEYGGGAYDVADGVVVYADLADGRLHVLRDGQEPLAISPARDDVGEVRYADLQVHPGSGLVLAVREDHRGDGEAVNTLVALDLAGPNADGGFVVAGGSDFYSTPQLASDGRLAWVQWDHPAMPWDATAVMVGRLRGGPGTGWTVAEARAVAGGVAESAVQPRWLPDGTLVLVSDLTGWWNLYAWNDGEPLRPLHAAEAEFGAPQWVLGLTPYAVVDSDHLLCSVLRSGVASVALLQVSTGELRQVTDAGTGARDLAAGTSGAAAVLTHPDRPTGLAVLDLDSTTWRERRPSSSVHLDPAAVSIARPVSWPRPDGEAGEVHGWYYPPTHPGYSAPDGDLPPLITLSHGGPTSFSSSALSLGCQFWTSRGYAVLDVNYGGSTGYGRAYRERLLGRWGLVDVADCAAGAQAMAEQGLADPHRLVVKGGSAGGYTTLRALTATTVFAAGISQYGVGDLEALARDTHKFESRYLDGLVGPYPEARSVYLERSPLSHLDSLSAPILLLQGTEDKVVPPRQAQDMADAARAQGLPVALLLFEGEGHGFRRADTIRASLDAQQYFLGAVLGFTPADDVPPIEIDNLPTAP